MSYDERPDGYKGVKYGIMAMTALGVVFLLRVYGGLFGSPPPTTPAEAERQLLNDPENGEVFGTLKRTFPAEFDGLTKVLAQGGSASQSNREIKANGRAYLVAEMKRHLGAVAQAPHDTLADYRKAEIQLIRALQSDDVSACATYFSTGEINLPSETSAEKTAMREFQINSWVTEAAGRDNPAGRYVSKPAPQDFASIVSGAAQRGSSSEDVNNLIYGVPMVDQAKCNAGLAMLTGIDALPDTVADNFTAFMIQSVAAKP